ncbi:MAG: 23S rRNA (uracil(1939)-C(5))-methyltransferase RlmD [Chloroflexi bacterium]|nr:23S rRNA (uracil(1939)-C(5))-methyltransferase RlmD [Chloroflexota bacterium]
MARKRRRPPELVRERHVVELTDIAYLGEAIARIDGEVIFVMYGIPGETVEIELYRQQSKFARAEVVRVLRPSESRVAPPCPYFGVCGGCQWQHIAYPAQLEYKRHVVAEQLRRLGRFDDAADLVAPTLPAPQPFHYRNHARFTGGRQGRLGFTRWYDHRFLQVRYCYLMHPAINGVLADLQGQAYVKHQVAVRYGVNTGSLLIQPALSPRTEPAARSGNGAPGGDHESSTTEPFIPFLPESQVGPPLSASSASSRLGVAASDAPIAVQLHTRGRPDPDPLPGAEDSDNAIVPESFTGPVAATPQLRRPTGQAHYEEALLGRRFRVSAASFFQVNTLQAEQLVQTVADKLELRGDETLVDLYCGVGTFALLLAGRVRRVVGIEESPAALKDARVNAEGVSNVEFIVGKAEEVFPSLKAEGIDAVVVDPPRAGLRPPVIEALIRLRPRKIAYVSCEPSTLARDLRLLVDGGFTLTGVQPVDMFPQTYHIECVSILTVQSK